MVLAPALHLLNEERAARLRAFVEGGGQLVLTVRCGMKDDRNALLPTRQPGPLAEAAGVEVEDYYALLDPVPVSGPLFTGTSSIWAERLAVRDPAGTKVLARFSPSNGWLDNQPAITAHPWRSGLVYFVGAYLDETSQQTLLDRITSDAGVEPVMQTPRGVAARRRVDGQGKDIVIIINHEPSRQVVPLPWPATEHLSETNDIDEVSLAPYGVAVISRWRA